MYIATLQDAGSGVVALISKQSVCQEFIISLFVVSVFSQLGLNQLQEYPDSNSKVKMLALPKPYIKYHQIPVLWDYLVWPDCARAPGAQVLVRWFTSVHISVLSALELDTFMTMLRSKQQPP